MINYTKYFVTAQRADTAERFTKLTDDTPEDLKQLVYEIHDHFDAMPNDWIYETIDSAFDELSRDSLDNCSIEPDCYNGELYKWLGNPFAQGLCNEAMEEGICDPKQGIYGIISEGQSIATRQIYELVNNFLEDKENEE